MNTAIIGAILHQKTKKTSKRILYVCTGNIFRSMSAEYLSKKYIKDHKIQNLIISSAGTETEKQDPFHTTTERLKFYGCNTSNHKQRKISHKILEKQDIIICMAKHHQVEVKKLGFQSKLFNEIAYNKKENILDDGEYIKLHKKDINLEKYSQRIIDYIQKAIPKIIEKTKNK